MCQPICGHGLTRNDHIFGTFVEKENLKIKIKIKLQDQDQKAFSSSPIGFFFFIKWSREYNLQKALL